MMIFINEAYKAKAVYKPYAEGIVKMLSCIAPHICEEMWEKLGHEGTIAYEAWPTYEEDKLVVARARKVERFLSQPFSVAEVFTGSPGKYVPLKETIRGFKGIIDGEYDNLPEQAFYMVGTIDEAVEKAKNL